MSDVVTLSLRAPLEATLDVEALAPDRTASLGERDIAALPVFYGSRRAQLGDFFDVRGGQTDKLRVAGDLSNVDGIGDSMAGGELVVEGNVGRRVAARMTGGSLTVTGSAGDDAGTSMTGGVLRISENAGARLGAAAPGASKGMSGGEIVVLGSAGAEAAARLRRGLIVVGRDAGADAGRAMIAGTLIVLGRTGEHPGRGNKRGSIVAVGGIDVPVTYRYACTFAPPHLRFTMTYLRRRHAIAIAEAVIGGLYRRYCGDLGVPGKGEILEWVAG